MESVYKILFVFILILLVQCNEKEHQPTEILINGGLFTPDNFDATIVVDSIFEKARHIAVNKKGDVFVNLRYSKKGKSVAVLRDTDGDGNVDLIEKFGDSKNDKYGRSGSYSTAMRIYNGYLYFSSELVVYRYKLNPDTQQPEGEIQIIMTDDHEHGRHQHIGKPIAFDNKGYLYVPFGGPSNACMESGRTPGSKGMDPCPQLENHGGIWRFDANKIGQTQKDGYKFATGIRSVVALDWNPIDENLYAVVHGRDDLLRLFPDKFSAWESALLPSEEFIKITDGSDFGWPYCYYDQLKGQKVLAPEYGGDGNIIGRCDQYEDPILGFPGHWAPNDLVFYNGDQFPDRYKNGAFIAFHGSTNRTPYPQSGYFVAFVPFEKGQPVGGWEVFADGFAEADPIVNVKDAKYRPMGIAVGPDGELYIADTEKGRVWKIDYKGDKKNFGEDQLVKMEKRKMLTHLRDPNEVDDNLMKDNLTGGEKLYFTYCSSCHQLDGHGSRGRFPPLIGTDWVLGDKTRLIKLLLEGYEGVMEVKGRSYSGLMPQHSFLKDQELSSILTYIRTNFGNEASAIETNEIKEVRDHL